MATFQEELLNVLRRDNEQEELDAFGEAWESPGTEVVGSLGQLLKVLSENEKTAILQTGGGGYIPLGTLIGLLTPYGSEIVAFPVLSAETIAEPANLADLEKIKEDYGIEIGGWLRKNHAAKPEPDELDSEEMSKLNPPPERVFRWPFRFTSNVDVDGPEQSLTITKGVKIPFLYRQPGKKRFLLAHIVIGFEGAGHG